MTPPTSEGWSNEEKEHLFRTSLPSATLRHLDLSFTGLGTIPSKSFVRFSNLKFLSLEFNSLTLLEKDTFVGLESLRVLWLTGNHIQPDEDIYQVARALENNIQKLETGLFEPVRNTLQVLLLHHNNLKTLGGGGGGSGGGGVASGSGGGGSSSINQELRAAAFAPDNMPSLRVLKLLDNPWSGESLATIQAVKDLWEKNKGENGGRGVCDDGVPSRGNCLQLDVVQDNGDDLEDIWDDLGIGLADEAVLVEHMHEWHKVHMQEMERMKRMGGSVSGLGEKEEEEEEERYEM